MKRLAVLLAVAAAVGVASEAAFRLWGPVQDALVYQDSADPVLRFELRPGAEGMKGGAWVRINSGGLRDREIPEEKPKGEYRVLIVGDHYTFGFGVADQDAYVRRLEALVKAPPGYDTLTTINLSMYHYNLAQKIELLRARGLRYHPDVVVFQASPDDGGSLPPAWVPLGRLKNFIRARSRFLRWLMERIYWSRKPPPKLNGMRDPSHLQERLREIGDLLNDGRVPGLVVYFPNLTDSAAGPATQPVARRFMEAAKEAGLSFYDAAEAFKGRSPASLLQQPSLPFLNGEGHRAAAQGIAAQIRKLIPPPPPKKLKTKRVG